jgi:hypothetical protein
MQPNEIIEVLNRPISQELLARDVTRLACVAEDGAPRNVPGCRVRVAMSHAGRPGHDGAPRAGAEVAPARGARFGDRDPNRFVS